MNSEIWIPSVQSRQKQYRLVRKFPRWSVQAWVGNQCAYQKFYWKKSKAQQHISIATKIEKLEHSASRLTLGDA